MLSSQPSSRWERGGEAEGGLAKPVFTTTDWQQFSKRANCLRAGGNLLLPRTLHRDDRFPGKGSWGHEVCVASRGGKGLGKGEGGLCAQLDTQILEPALQHAVAVDLGVTCRFSFFVVVVGTLGEAGARGE